MKPILLIALFFLLLPAVAQAREKAPDPARLPALMKIKAEGKDLSYDYVGRRFGLDAWLISGKGVMQMVYTVPGNGAALVGGLLIGPDGKEAATDLQKDFAAKNPERARDILVLAAGTAPDAAATTPPSDRAEKLWAEMAALGIVTYGPPAEDAEDAKVIYAVLDPAQPQSRLAWTILYPLAQQGRITLKVVPLAVTSADNIMAIAQVLGAPDPKTSWIDLLDGKFDKLPQSPDPQGAQGLQSNTAFAQRLKLYTLPFLVYRQADTGTIRALKGMPKDWKIVLNDMAIERKVEGGNSAAEHTPPASPVFSTKGNQGER